jgi:broad specificity phosphatase PhoE
MEKAPIGGLFHFRPNNEEPPMQITLMRHGRPLIDTGSRLSAARFGQWLHAYDQAGIDPAHPPTPDTIRLAQGANMVVCSPLPRSRESARMLGLEAQLCEPLFREMEMPWTNVPGPALSPKAWCVMFRLAWLLGFAAHAESFAAARQRARDCAARLATLAQQHGSVVLIGHGTLNWGIARALRTNGWSGPAAPRRHWEAATYRLTPR